MKVLIAPDSFKESLTAAEVAGAIARGIHACSCDIQCIEAPVADGGEGTLDAILSATQGERIELKVRGPLGNPVQASYGLIEGGKVALVEMAYASGLHLVPQSRRNPMVTSTFGTGQLIRHALDAGVEKIYLTLGGSATNDAGAGMLSALGVVFTDRSGAALAPGGGDLSRLHQIDRSGLDRRLEKLRIDVACDVNNPLCGASGASAVFGPQKGATPEMVVLLDRALGQFSDIIEKTCGVSVADVPGAGAAGGMGAACLAFFNARLVPGIDMVLEAVRLSERMRGVDFVIIGEGRIDHQTLHGKAPQGVFEMAQRMGIPVIAIGGCLGRGWEALQQIGVERVYSAMPDGMSVAEAMARAEENLHRVAGEVARDFFCGQ